MTPRNEWLFRLAGTTIGLLALLDTGRRRGWL
jgi:hypothetical protein